MKKTVSFKANETEWQRLAATAKRTGLSQSDILRLGLSLLWDFEEANGVKLLPWMKEEKEDDISDVSDG